MTRVSDGAEEGDSECSALLGGSELARKIWEMKERSMRGACHSYKDSAESGAI